MKILKFMNENIFLMFIKKVFFVKAVRNYRVEFSTNSRRVVFKHLNKIIRKITVDIYYNFKRQVS